MRIATSTIFDQQTSAIDNLTAQQAQYGQELSTGKSLNVPSDNPTVIAQDLSVRTSLAVDNQVSQNAANLQNQLTTVDGSLATLTNVLQSARGFAVQGASDTLSPADGQNLASQINQLLNESISVANTQYAGTYIFSGTKIPPVKAVTPNGAPTTSVTVTTNAQTQTQEFSNGQPIQTSVTLQQGFNYQSFDGSPDVFQALITLRDTLQNQSVVDKSGSAVNVPGTVVTTVAPSTPLNSANFSTPILPDSTGNVSINISSSKDLNGTTFTFNPATATVASVLTSINAATATTGVSASFDNKQERLILTSSVGSFQVQDIGSPGATNTGNFVEAFHLQSQADLVNNISTQIGDLDRVLQQVISARSSIGSAIQQLAALSGTMSTAILNQTKVQSNLEDTNVPQVVSLFSQTQTALQAAYATTSRLEGKTLFDYLP